jgi:hypothetical protein
MAATPMDTPNTVRRLRARRRQRLFQTILSPFPNAPNCLSLYMSEKVSGYLQPLS